MVGQIGISILIMDSVPIRLWMYKRDLMSLIGILASSFSVANYDGITILMSTIWKNKTEFAKLLITKGADIEATNNDRGENALMIAAYTGNLEILNLLIS